MAVYYISHKKNRFPISVLAFSSILRWLYRDRHALDLSPVQFFNFSIWILLRIPFVINDLLAVWDVTSMYLGTDKDTIRPAISLS